MSSGKEGECGGLATLVSWLEAGARSGRPEEGRSENQFDCAERLVKRLLLVEGIRAIVMSHSLSWSVAETMKAWILSSALVYQVVLANRAYRVCMCMLLEPYLHVYGDQEPVLPGLEHLDVLAQRLDQVFHR